MNSLLPHEAFGRYTLDTMQVDSRKHMSRLRSTKRKRKTTNEMVIAKDIERKQVHGTKNAIQERIDRDESADSRVVVNRGKE